MECVEQSHLLMSTLELWAKKATAAWSEEAAECMLNEVAQLQMEWDKVQAAAADEKPEIESHLVQLEDYDAAVKSELAWMQDVGEFADSTELCADLAEIKARLQRTKVDRYWKSYLS